jgi:hypothetical protein
MVGLGGRIIFGELNPIFTILKNEQLLIIGDIYDFKCNLLLLCYHL